MEKWDKLCDGVWCGFFDGVWKIRYEFCDGTAHVEATDEDFLERFKSLAKKEDSNDRRETRRHVSLYFLNENGIDIEDKRGDCLTQIIRQEDGKKLEIALSQLLPQQRELLEKIFFDGVPLTEIAKKDGVGKSAIANRLTKIYVRLKKLLQ